ncbi:hypothetical protein LTS18_007670 [Coniosporium uncinatum]|uniref:Uncharacterized protein n=2 Tax=Coniosporium uncinatum TaxID=93489 RepID=A0ACC3DX62_9PEZI|nr:hypothetical protein LTS18_008992 [Coniosporium uncinatum]KAK3081343.1 hypothetical protein LTS18_007670 [Coniosporium uncinatum]
MSTIAHSTPNKPAPWRATFLEHINKMPSPEFVFTSLAVAPKGSPTPYVPRARYCIYRGLWTELPENKHNTAEKNPRVYESDMPTFTSDVRMQKVGQVFGSSAGHADSDEQVQGSGGGGPVEAVWWVKDEDIMTQWRMRGEAFVVGPDIESAESEEPGGGKDRSGVRTTKSELGKRMRVVDEEKEGEWSWKRELTGHFGNLSPGMRGSFAAPPPGMPKDKKFDDEHLGLGKKITENEDPVAGQNFRVVVIKPEFVEQCYIGDPNNSWRMKYTYDDSTGDWKTEETWP